MSRIEAYNKSVLARHLTKEDFYNNNALSDREYRSKVVEEAAKEADNLFFGDVKYNSFEVKNRRSFAVESFSQKLVFRVCASYLNRSFSRKAQSRSQIARQIREFLADGTPYVIYRLDIESFFENIDRQEMECDIDELKGISMHTKKLLKQKMHFFESKEGVAVPRGIETSAVLSDLHLKDFDYAVLSTGNVFFYSRFVDDILIVSSGEEDESAFKAELSELLPRSLSFNDEKTEVNRVNKRSVAGDKNKGNEVARFDYLGFRFYVIDTPLTIARNGEVCDEKSGRASQRFRDVQVDLSPKKVKRIKDKLCKAFYSFSKTGDYELLKDRIKFLTTNREFKKKDDSVMIPVGIYYDSSACDFPSTQLCHLDYFLRTLVFSQSGRLSKKYAGMLTKNKKKQLVRFSFSKGFSHRVHRRFSYERLSEIVKVWK